jgi:hypothetical protein
LSLIECIVLMVVMSIVSVGAGVGLQSVSRSWGGVDDKLWTSQQLISKMESLRDTAYASLASGSSTSDANYKGTTYTITWTVTEIDPAKPTQYPPAAKANSGLKQLTVSMNGQSLSTWISQ